MVLHFNLSVFPLVCARFVSLQEEPYFLCEAGRLVFLLYRCLLGAFVVFVLEAL